MSDENVEIVRRLWEAAESRNTASVLSLYDPDVELDVSAFPLADTSESVYRGHDGLTRLFSEWREVWDGADSELLEVLPARDRVVTVYRYRGRGRRSGLPVEEEFATLWSVEAGKITRVKWFAKREEALEAAGLGA